jgi:23S rRNA-/tRNA-specific pseudouridylate synthase
MTPCVIFEDDHLLVVNKPPGLNTHAPSPYAGEGIYEWLKHREPRWAALAIVHRLDKETSHGAHDPQGIPAADGS